MQTSMTRTTTNVVLSCGGDFRACFRCGHLTSGVIKHRAVLFLQQIHDIMMNRQRTLCRLRLKPEQSQIWEKTDDLLKRWENQLLDGLTNVRPPDAVGEPPQFSELILRVAADMDSHCEKYYGKDWSFVKVSSRRACVVM